MENAGTKEISYDDLKALLENKDKLILIDVRSPQEVAGGHIPGSVNIPVDKIQSALQMTPDEFRATYGIDKEQLNGPNLVFHCQMGMRGGRATDIAKNLGYTNARNYKGGYKEWSSKEVKQ
ncbi:thiosulfate:glutathione sulfurtransferase-like [Pholidichthys leucotaenia]